MNYLKLDQIEAYNLAIELSAYVWDIVIRWDNFAKFSCGQQYVQSTDSISANIAEGFGRYTKKDKIRFYRIAQGSLLESTNWTAKAKRRNQLSDEEFSYIMEMLERLPKSINSLIKFTNEKLKF